MKNRLFVFLWQMLSSYMKILHVLNDVSLHGLGSLSQLFFYLTMKILQIMEFIEDHGIMALVMLMLNESLFIPLCILLIFLTL